jgi:hypothetical protein
MVIVLSNIYRTLKLQNTLADQSLLSSMVLCSVELSALYQNYSSLAQMNNIIRILYNLLNPL